MTPQKPSGPFACLAPILAPLPLIEQPAPGCTPSAGRIRPCPPGVRSSTATPDATPCSSA